MIILVKTVAVSIITYHPSNFQFYSQFEWKNQIYLFSNLGMSKSQIHWDKILSSQLLPSKWPWFNTSVPKFLAWNIVVYGGESTIFIHKTLDICSNFMKLGINIYFCIIWNQIYRRHNYGKRKNIWEFCYKISLYLLNVMNVDKIVY